MQAQIDRRFDVIVGRIDTVEAEVGKLEARADSLPQNLSFLNGDALVRPNASNEAVESNPEPEAYRASFDVQRVRPSTAIVLAIASIEDVDPTEISSLYDMLDPEALDTLIQSTPPGTAGDIQVSVCFDEYRVTSTVTESSGSARMTMRTTRLPNHAVSRGSPSPREQPQGQSAGSSSACRSMRSSSGSISSKRGPAAISPVSWFHSMKPHSVNFGRWVCLS